MERKWNPTRMITSNLNLRSYHDNKWNNKSWNRLTSHYKLERNSIEDLPKEQPVAPVRKTETLQLGKLIIPVTGHVTVEWDPHRLSRIPYSLTRGKCFFPNGKDVSSRGRLTFMRTKRRERNCRTLSMERGMRENNEETVKEKQRERERERKRCLKRRRGWGTEA